MAKYFLDTEFHEGFHKPLFGRKRHFIDFISIGIVAEDNREYYAISKDFDIKAAWNAFDLKPDINEGGMKKVYWLRGNVLKPIFAELLYSGHKTAGIELPKVDPKQFTYSNFKKFILAFGKSNKQIAEEIKDFVDGCECFKYQDKECKGASEYAKSKSNYYPEFYGYYADYDWAVFCSLFGKMIDLPTGFPMYCKDLKQILDGKANDDKLQLVDKNLDWLKYIKNSPNYPKQTNEHNALADAKWNKELHQFLNTI